MLGAGEGESLGVVAGTVLGGVSLGVDEGAGELGVAEALGPGALGVAGTAGATVVAGAGIALAGRRRAGGVDDAACAGAARRSTDIDGDVDAVGVWAGSAGAREVPAGFGFALGCGLVRTVVLATGRSDSAFPCARTMPAPVPMVAVTASATASAYRTARRWATGSIRRWTPRYRACTGRLHQMGPRRTRAGRQQAVDPLPPCRDMWPGPRARKGMVTGITRSGDVRARAGTGPTWSTSGRLIRAAALESWAVCLSCGQAGRSDRHYRRRLPLPLRVLDQFAWAGGVVPG